MKSKKNSKVPYIGIPSNKHWIIDNIITVMVHVIFYTHSKRRVGVSLGGATLWIGS